jgi:hypothetical protein
VDAHGNPAGEPMTIATDLTGPASRRDGRLRAAISEIIRLAREHGCAGIAIENLGFDDARTTGRETMGRGRRGRKFRRTVAGMPTAQFRERIRGMAFHQDLIVLAVDPAYTSRWGGQHWQAPLRQQAGKISLRHPASRCRGGRRQACSRPRDTASARRDRSRPEDRAAESCRPGRISPDGTRDRTPVQDPRHAP